MTKYLVLAEHRVIKGCIVEAPDCHEAFGKAHCGKDLIVQWDTVYGENGQYEDWDLFDTVEMTTDDDVMYFKETGTLGTLAELICEEKEESWEHEELLKC